MSTTFDLFIKVILTPRLIVEARKKRESDWFDWITPTSYRQSLLRRFFFDFLADILCKEPFLKNYGAEFYVYPKVS